MSVRLLEKLKEKLAEGVELVAAGGTVEELRRVKDEEELAAIAEASKLADEVWRWTLEQGLAGRSEREVARAAEARIRELGGDPSFPAIVAAGPNGALPHAEPGEREIGRGELVVFDMGAKLDGYCSDGTRTFATGEPGEEARAVYEVVRGAQQAALEAVRAGVKGEDVDSVARKVIDDAGYGEHFGHGARPRRRARGARGAAALAALRGRARAGRSGHGRARHLPAGQARGADRGPGRRHRGRPPQSQRAAEGAADRRIAPDAAKAAGSNHSDSSRRLGVADARPHGQEPATRWSRSTRKRGASACSTWRSACAATASPASRSSPWRWPSAAAARSATGGSSRLPPASPASRSPTASCAAAPGRRSGSPAPGRRCRSCSPPRSLLTGGATSPVLVWFAPAGGHPRLPLRAARDGRRHRLHAGDVPRRRGRPRSRRRPGSTPELIAIAALIVSTVILSGALVESDRAHRRRSTLDPLTGLFNRNALEQRLAELDGQPLRPATRASPRLPALRPRPLQAGQRPARPRRRRRGPPGCRLHDAGGAARRRLDLPGRRRGDPGHAARRRPQRRAGDRRAPAGRGPRPPPGRRPGLGQHRRRRRRDRLVDTDDLSAAGRRGALRGQGRRPRQVVVTSTAGTTGPGRLSG